eukprot:jgi/Botrbrau1/11448/Bobra.0328s0008.1
MRDALFEHYIANRIGFREFDIACNDVHPNYLYHRYTADMLISFLQDQVAGLLVSPVTPWEVESLKKPLTRPMLVDNYEQPAPCLSGPSLLGAVSKNQGWLWQTGIPGEGIPRDSFLSTTPGDRIIFKVDTSRHIPTPRGNEPHEVMLGVTFLVAPITDNMGLGKVSCHLGCKCTAGTIDFRAAWFAFISSHRWAYLPVTVTRDCFIEVSNVSPSPLSAKLVIYAISILPVSRTVAEHMSVYARNTPDIL